MEAETLVVDVAWEERYWYPEDGGVVWVAGYHVLDPASGLYLARDAPELEGLGLRVASVAGAGRHHADALAAEAVEPGRPLELRRDPDNPHDSNAIAVVAGEQVGWVPARARRRVGAVARRRRAAVGGRAARAAPLSARSAAWLDDAAGGGAGRRAERRLAPLRQTGANFRAPELQQVWTRSTRYSWWRTTTPPAPSWPTT